MRRWLFVSLSLLLLGCQPSRTFSGIGRVVGFGDDQQTVFINHGDIEGLMPAMTMPFAVQDSSALAALEMGDAVRFDLHVTPRTSWIAAITRIPLDSLPLALQGTPVQSPLLAEGALALGDPVPDFSFLDQTGAVDSLAAFRGRAVLLTFIYTRCPLPDYCPLLSQQFRVLQPRLREQFGADVHLLSLSFDPAYDTPAVLRAYGERYTRRFDNWTLAAVLPDQMDDALKAFGMFVTGDDLELIHNLMTVLIDAEGQVQAYWRGNYWQPEDVMRELATLFPAS